MFARPKSPSYTVGMRLLTFYRSASHALRQRLNRLRPARAQIPTIRF